MSSEYIFKESQKMFDLSDKYLHADIYEIELPTINKINNMDIICNLSINKFSAKNKKNKKKNNYSIEFCIESKKISYCDGNNYILYEFEEKLHPFNSTSINKFLLKIKNDILPKIKLDKVFGKFIHTNDNKEKIINNDNVGEDIFGFEYSNYSQCSVCYENTFTCTACTHPLCVECWNKITNDSCPICRNLLIMHSDTDDHCDINTEYFDEHLETESEESERSEESKESEESKDCDNDNNENNDNIIDDEKNWESVSESDSDSN